MFSLVDGVEGGVISVEGGAFGVEGNVSNDVDALCSDKTQTRIKAYITFLMEKESIWSHKNKFNWLI